MKQIKALIKKLSRLVDAEKFRTALRIYEKRAQAFLRSRIDQRDRTELLLLGAEIYHFNQMYGDSSACLSEIERLDTNIISNMKYIRIKFHSIYITGSIDTALEFMNSAISKSRSEVDRQRLNHYLGKAYFWKGDYTSANHCLQECLQYFLSTSHHDIIGSVYHYLGYTGFKRSYYDIAESFYKKSLEQFKIAAKNNMIGCAYGNLGILYYRIGRYDTSLKHCRLARSHFEKCESSIHMLESDIQFAHVAMFQERYSEAKRLLRRSYDESMRIGYRRGAALSAQFLGEIHLRLADYEKSQEYLETAEEIASEIAPSGDIAVEVYRHLGDLFIARKNTEQAEKYLSKAFEIAQKSNARHETGAIHRLYGLLYAYKKKFDLAKSHIETSILITNDQYSLAHTYMSAADIYRQWADSGDIDREKRADLLRDADTYELEAMYIFKSIGLDTKSEECEARRRKRETQFPRKEKSSLINIDFDRTCLYQDGIVAKSLKMRDAINKAERLASSGIPVLITGETGTGKEIIARLLHQLSGRSSGPFVPVNCAAIADTVFESELFGHKKGAFTSAVNDRTGLIELASGGTLFLDEISELTDRQQAKLLRTLEEGNIRRVGETKERPVDVRIVSASNDSIGALLDSGRLRLDFFFRISVERIDLAPLRERIEDIMPLFFFYAQTISNGQRIERDITAIFERYDWPGNVRELINVVKSFAQLKTNDGVIRIDDIPSRIREYDPTVLKSGRERYLERRHTRKLMTPESCKDNPGLIRKLIVSSLERCNGNHSAAARELGISRTTLYRRMKKLGMV